MTKPWLPYARHILDAIAKVRRIEARGDLTQDDVLYDAVIRNLQTLSEATQMLPKDLTDARPEIPWREISLFRNILAHNYLGSIDPKTVARVLQNDLDPWKNRFAPCLTRWVMARNEWAVHRSLE